MTEPNGETSTLPPIGEYIRWVINKPSNQGSELNLGVLRESASRFGLTRQQMVVLLRLLAHYEILLDKGRTVGGLEEGGKNSGTVLYKDKNPDLAGLIYIGFDGMAAGQGVKDRTLGELHPIVNDVACKARQQLMNDPVLQKDFPGIGRSISGPVWPANSDLSIDLSRTLFDPRPFMNSQPISNTLLGGTVIDLERISRVGIRARKIWW